MKKVLSSAVFFTAILLFSVNCFAQSTKVAVLDLDGGTYYKDYASTVTGIIISELSADKKVELVERTQLKKVLDEHGLMMSGIINPEQAVELGKFLAIKKLITGTFGNLGNQFVITVRMIDIETAKVDLAITETIPDSASLPSGSKVVAEKLLNAIKNGGTVSESAREKLKYSCETKKDAVACFKLGIMWYNGVEGMKNQIFARSYFSYSCNYGHAKACYYAGTMFKKGLGGNKSTNDAEAHFKAACDSGFKKGCEQKKAAAAPVKSKGMGGDAFGELEETETNNSVTVKKKSTVPADSEDTISELEE